MASTGIFSLLLLLCLARVGKPDLESDRNALLALRSAVGRSLPWNASQSPCSWQGVVCESNRVTTVRLPGVGLMGPIPSGVLGNLTAIHTLSLRFNALTGPLPSDIALCADLRNLYLQDNKLSGEIPSSIFGLPNLVRLNLAGNNFSGQISPDFNKLTRLGTLFLESNHFSGAIPDLKLPNLIQFNVSFNNLTGSLPRDLRRMPATAFFGNSLCGRPLTPCPGEDTPLSPSSPPPSSLSKKKKISGGAIAGIAIGSAVAVLVLTILIVLCQKKKTPKTGSVEIAAAKQVNEESDVPMEKSTVDREIGALPAAGATEKKAMGGGETTGSNAKKLVFFGQGGGRVFDLEDLLRASAEVLGKGTFGTAYKAVLEVGAVVAVKRLKDVNIPEREFREKIEAVGSMDHENLVPLRAYYFSKDEKLLVHDYMPMGSLSALLHGNRGGGRTPLNWETRLGIALSAGRGIEYLHKQGPSVSHGNIKSSNILLTNSYGARVSDFGLAHLVGPSSTPNRIAGYRAPEVTDARKVSQKADVYSFGVLLLELLTGKAPTHSLLNEEGVDLPRWVQSIVREEWTAEVFDLELLRYQNIEEEMVQLLQLAIECTAQYPDKRPSMSEVVRRIEELRGSQSDDHHQHVDVADDISLHRTGDSAPPATSLLD